MITPSGLNYQAPSCGVCVIMHRKGRVVQSAHVLVNKTIHTIEKDICLCVQLHMCMCVCVCVLHTKVGICPHHQLGLAATWFEM